MCTPSRRSPEVGGNYRAISLDAPPGYDGSYGPLRADVGAQRVNVLTLTEERRSYTYYNLTTYCACPDDGEGGCGHRHVPSRVTPRGAGSRPPAA